MFSSLLLFRLASKAELLTWCHTCIAVLIVYWYKWGISEYHWSHTSALDQITKNKVLNSDAERWCETGQLLEDKKSYVGLKLQCVNHSGIVYFQSFLYGGKINMSKKEKELTHILLACTWDNKEWRQRNRRRESQPAFYSSGPIPMVWEAGSLWLWSSLSELYVCLHNVKPRQRF